MGPVTVYWYDGGLRPPTPPGIDPDDPKQRLGEGSNGIIFVGEKGIITCAGWSGMPRLLPLELHREYKRPEKTLPRVEGHHADWLQACKGGKPASSNFEYGARLCEFVLLGNVALRSAEAPQVGRPEHEGHQRDGREPVSEGTLPLGLGAPRIEVVARRSPRRQTRRGFPAGEFLSSVLKSSTPDLT